jgi:SAM-dependent methyltransferase
MSFLHEPRLQGVTIGSPEFFRIQNDLIAKRPALRHCYDIWYRTLLEDPAIKKAPPDARFLELGSGGSRLKEHDARIITSDVSPEIADMVIDARQLPFSDASLHAIFLTHVFHHIPDVSQFLKEAERVLVPGGFVGMIDVAATPFARFFFRNFHPEPFLPKAGWSFAQEHSMMDSNQALTWIVFKRDYERFQREFPELLMEEKRYLPWLPYLLSGGVTRKDILPKSIVPAIIGTDHALRALYPFFSLHWFIRLRKPLRREV